jgi:hypothetical protein
VRQGKEGEPQEEEFEPLVEMYMVSARTRDPKRRKKRGM